MPVGVYFSSLSNQAAVAALGAFSTLFFLWVIGADSSAYSGDASVTAYLSIVRHLASFLDGTLNSVDVVYYLLLCGLFIALSIRQIDHLRVQPLMRNLLHRLKFSAALYALLGLCAWLSTQYTYQWRSVEARYHLSPTSIKAVQALDGTLSVDAWIPPNALLQNRVTALFNKYQRHKIDMSLNFIDPATRPL